MHFREVVATLEDAFTRDLPGQAAQAPFEPVPRRQWPAAFDRARLRHAAGLLLVFPFDTTTARAVKAAEAHDSSRTGSLGPLSGEAHIVLTVRADTLGRHGGQVSLPGGAIDPGETFEHAALREAQEEVGLAPEQVRLLGRLTPLDIPVSGFRLHPIVAASETRPTLTAADGEVARILEVDLEDLLAPDCLAYTHRERDGIAFATPGFHVHGVEIWGATAMVLAEFLSLLGWSVRQTS